MLQVNFLQFCINFLVQIFPVKILISESTRNFWMISVLFYSLIWPVYHHANKSISTIGYLFMRGVTFDQPWLIRRLIALSISCRIIDWYHWWWWWWRWWWGRRRWRQFIWHSNSAMPLQGRSIKAPHSGDICWLLGELSDRVTVSWILGFIDW